MLNNFFKKLTGLIKAEKKIFLVLAVLLVAFFINRELYVGKKTTSEKCSGGKCLENLADAPQLDEKKTHHYVDDLFLSQPSGFYRLTFWEKSDQAEKVFLKLSTYTEKENQIGELTFSPSADFQKQELFFFLPEGFGGLLFQKENFQGKANIFVKEVGVTKLNIDSHAELAKMQKTILSEGAKIDLIRASQSGGEYAFSWLKEKKTILGQVFLASDDLITAVALDITTKKTLDPGSRQYGLNLRKVNYDGKNVSFSGSTIASLDFSVKGIEKYRQADGTFLFPLYAKLEKGAYYSVSLDNSKVGVSEQNYLEFRGTRKSDSYADGAAIVRKFNSLYVLDGDLFFKVYGADFWEESGVRILSGAKIEDLGKGLGKYSYETKGKFADLMDLDVASSGTNFSSMEKTIIAPAKLDTSFSYAVNTIYPMKKINFSATQIKASWKKVKVSYSFDRSVWVDLDYSEEDEVGAIDLVSGSGAGGDVNVAKEDDSMKENSEESFPEQEGVAEKKRIQIFNSEIIPTKEARTIYFRTTYDESDESPARFFALKNLKITADLKMK